MSKSNREANVILQKIDMLIWDLAELASNPRAENHLRELRIFLGFSEGGYVGRDNLGELVEDGHFNGAPDDDEDCDEDWDEDDE